MDRENLKRITSLNYKHIGSIKEVDGNQFFVSIFDGKEKFTAPSIKEAIKFVKMKTMIIQEVSPIPCVIDFFRVNNKKTYILFPSIKDDPSSEISSYHYIKLNSNMTDSSVYRLSKHMNPESISFNNIARVVMHKSRTSFILNIILSAITILLLLMLLGGVIIFGLFNESIIAASDLTDMPAITPEVVTSLVFFTIFGVLLIFTNIGPFLSYRRHLYDRESKLSFENKSWWKQYKFKMSVGIVSIFAIFGFIISAFFSSYFASNTVFINSYFYRSFAIIYVDVVSILSIIFASITAASAIWSMISSAQRKKIYLDFYVPSSERSLFEGWARSPKAINQKFDFNYAGYIFKPSKEFIKAINKSYLEKEKLSDIKIREIRDWTNSEYKKAVKSYLHKKKLINDRGGL